MNQVALGLAIGLFSVASLSACKTTNSAAKSASDAGGQQGNCQVLDFQTGQTADLNSDHSPFATLILNNRSVKFQPSNGTNPSCPTTIHEVVSAFDAIPNSSRKIFVVDEIADQSTDQQSDGKHRFVVSQRAGQPNETDADTFFAPVERGPGTFDLNNLEVISFDATRGANVFYKFMGGRWNLMGNGTQIDPQKSQNVESAPGQFFCQSCHPTGALNFKELKLPWGNWNGNGALVNSFSNFFQMPGFPAPNDHLMNAWMNGNDATMPKEPRTTSAYTFQPLIQNGNKRLVALRVKQVLAGGGGYPGQSLQTLVREQMCDVGEVNLASSLVDSRIGNRGSRLNLSIPSSFFVNDGLGFVSFRFDRDSYLAAIADQKMASIPGNDAMFCLFGPERSFVDMQVGAELINQGWLTKETLADILMTDFPNPMFSTQRCDLASTIPDVAAGTSASDGANGAAAFISRWIDNLKQSNLPGAPGLADRLSKDGQVNTTHKDRLKAYANACSARANNDPDNFMQDLVKLVQQRREELRQDKHLNRGNQGFPQIIESVNLFPIPGSPATPGALHMQEDCTLGPSAPVIGPS